MNCHLTNKDPKILVRNDLGVRVADHVFNFWKKIMCGIQFKFIWCDKNVQHTSDVSLSQENYTTFAKKKKRSGSRMEPWRTLVGNVVREDDKQSYRNGPRW